MLPIQPVARLSSPTPKCFFMRIGLLRKKCRTLIEENLRPFVSPWRPLQGVCPTQGFIWYSDNQNVGPIIFNSSRILHLQVLALQAFQIPGIWFLDPFLRERILVNWKLLISLLVAALWKKLSRGTWRALGLTLPSSGYTLSVREARLCRTFVQRKDRLVFIFRQPERWVYSLQR